MKSLSFAEKLLFAEAKLVCVFRNSCGEKISHFSKFPSVPQFIKSSAASRVASVAALISPPSAGMETVKHTEHIILTHAHAKCWQLDAAVGICFFEAGACL